MSKHIPLLVLGNPINFVGLLLLQCMSHMHTVDCKPKMNPNNTCQRFKVALFLTSLPMVGLPLFDVT